MGRPVKEKASREGRKVARSQVMQAAEADFAMAGIVAVL
jgi:hypothetical protein